MLQGGFPPKKIELPEELTIVHGSTLEVVRQKWGESDGLGKTCRVEDNLSERYA